MEELIIGPNLLSKQYIKDLVRFKDLFYFFAWRDILVRYKQAFFGVAWAILRPLLSCAAIVFVFGRLANLESHDVSYVLFVMSALLPWQLFSSSLNDGGLSLLNNSTMLTKIYFPRIVIPCSVIAVNFADMLISFFFFLGVAVVLKQPLSWYSLFIPLIFIHAAAFSAAVSIWISALTVRYRDFRFIIPFVTQFGLFVSPVGYSTHLIEQPLRLIYSLNPIVGIIDASRWALFGLSDSFSLISWCLSFLITLILLSTGFLYFSSMEKQFADII